ncbi:hypothetical protein Rhal01_00947 [Rubritalea halochordaticola]|uniref:Sulfotransferase family protein n=1 Tax=Rubritalea halochordaticola TaxID=714537 RepID=A0ABP9UWE6_9BACT
MDSYYPQHFLLISIHVHKDQKTLAKAAKLASAGQFERALPLYNELVQKYPAQAELAMQLAKVLGLTGRWDDANEIHQIMLANSHGADEVKVRMARDLEERGDLRGALSVWRDLSQASMTHRQEGVFHTVRLLERLNEVDEALKLWGTFQMCAGVWGHSWLDGRLLMRRGGHSQAVDRFEKAYLQASGEFKLRCLSELVRANDRLEHYEDAWRWIQVLSEARQAEVDQFKKLPNLQPLGGHELPMLESVNEKDLAKGRQLIMMVGMPRSGTTLLAHQLHQRYELGLSEEYDYMKHLVDNVSFSSSKSRSPEGVKKRGAVSKYIDLYWEAQKQTGAFEGESADVPLLDKNPAMESLLPWVLALFPNVAIIWVERDPRDAWLSSVAMDAPVNPVSCWWQNPVDYGLWCQNLAESRELLEQALPEERFIRVAYRDLVSGNEKVLQRTASLLGLQARDETREAALVTSPSYVEVQQPVQDTRIDRWQKYRPFIKGDQLAAFDSLPEKLGIEA